MVMKLIRTNYNPSSNGIRFTLDNSSFSLYSRTDRVVHAYKFHGTLDTGVGSLYLMLYREFAIRNQRVAINSTGYNNYNTGVQSSQGIYTALRNTNTNVYIDINKTTFSITRDSTARPNRELYLLVLNNNGTLQYYDDVQLAFCFLGRYFTPIELNNRIDIIEAYMDANGKGVIP